jgi:hypothetical protein
MPRCTDCPSATHGKYDVIRDDVPYPVCQRCAEIARRRGEPVLRSGRWLLTDYDRHRA